MHQKSRGYEKQNQREYPEDHARPDRALIFRDMKDRGEPRAINPENLVEVPVDSIIHAFGVPSPPRPEPHPSGAADKCSDDDHQHPQADESKQKRPDRETALLVGVIT